MMTRPPVRKPPGQSAAASRAPTASVEMRLGQLQEQFDLLKMQVRQAQQLASLGTATATIAHEFSNLLTPVLNYCRAAIDSEDTDFKQKALKVTLKNVEILASMSERLLELNAAKPPKREPIRLREVIDDAVAALCRDLSKDGIDYTVSVDDALHVTADRLQLQQVLFNLLLNAREAMAPAHGGRLTVSATIDGDRVSIELRNTGDPIPPDLLPHVFEPLQSSKLPATDRRQRCRGLGLALCRDLVMENGGTIGVTSDAAAGTAFHITLPLATEPVHPA